jgi:hypothetical protein
LVDLEDPSTLGLDASLSERLSDYQNVLRVSRDALPMEDVPAGLLAGVLAEAREARTSAPERPSLWRRWRAALIPVFALAGTTAAVLWIVKPNEPSTAELAVEPTESAGAATTPDAAAPAPESEPPGAVAAEPMPLPEDADAPAKAEPAKEEAADAKQSSKPGAPAPKRDAKGAYADVSAAEPIEDALDKEQVWETIEQADEARRRGDCDDAERLYRRAEASAPNDKARGAVWMGLGLCVEQRDGDGSKLLNDAQAADPMLGPEIERERAASRSAAKQGKPAPKKKSKARKPDEAMQQNAFPGE